MTAILELQTDILAAAEAVEQAKRDIDAHLFQNADLFAIADEVKRVTKQLDDLKRLERSRRQSYAEAIIALHTYQQQNP